MLIRKIYNLPRELQLAIFEFYYKKQSKQLCEDLKSFVTTRDLLIKDYKAYWYVHMNENHLDWLANDITAYMNDCQATMNGYTKNHTDKWKRLFKFKNKCDDDIYELTLSFGINNVTQDIWTRIGIMTPQERIGCIDQITKMYST